MSALLMVCLAAAPADGGVPSAWEQLKAALPAAAAYRPEREHPSPLEALLAWVPAGRRTTVFDRQCRPIQTERRDDTLYGLFDLRTTSDATTRRRSAEEIVFGEGIMVTGGFSEAWTRAPDGGWKKGQAGVSGDGEPHGHGLSAVANDAAWYNLVSTSLSLGCVRVADEQQACADGRTRRCSRCDSFGLLARSSELGGGVERVARTVDGGTCSAPCPEPAPPADLAQLARAALTRASFVAEGDERHPFFFRSREACLRYWKREGEPPQPPPWRP